MITRSDRLLRRALASLLLTAVVVGAPSRAFADEPRETDALETKRERFRAGMDKYKEGAFAEAIEIWEAIYAELGAETGYRLAFNIGRAYEQLAATRTNRAAAVADTAKAARHYAAYVNEVIRRREAGESLEPLVERQEAEAKERLGKVTIQGEPDVLVRIDDEPALRHASSVVWLAPGPHVVTFHPGREDAQMQSVFVEAGGVQEIAPPPPKKKVVPVASPSHAQWELREDHPYPKGVLFVAAGVSALSVLVPVVFYANAMSVKDEYDASYSIASEARLSALSSEYRSARTTAYASLAVPALLAATTVGLGAYWYLGATKTQVRVGASATPGGALLGAGGRF